MYARRDIYHSTPDVTPFQVKPDSLRQQIFRILFGAGANIFLAGSVFAQDIEVEEILVESSRQADYRQRELSLGKFTEALLDTPQSITSISARLMEDRNAMNLDDALRNVPGITLGAGEFRWQGNNPTLRGFSSRNDIFLDGMRDLGNYARDPFNLDAVEVLLGPSSTAFGRGSTGGVINQSVKKPLDTELRKLHVNVGNADTSRLTADINQPLSQLGSGSGFRLNLLSHESEVPGRDVVESERVGIAPSLSLGLGNATRLTLSFMGLDSSSIPDYGLPWIRRQPAHGDGQNFYGFSSDFMDTEAAVTSLLLEHEINSTWTLDAQLRHADYYRESSITEPQVNTVYSQQDPPENVVVERMIFASESSEGMLQAQVNLRADFNSGNIEHTLIAGIEGATENSDPSFGFAGQTQFFDYGVPVPATNLANPVNGPYTGVTPIWLRTDAESDTLAGFLLDTIKFSAKWQLSLGARLDRFDTNYVGQHLDVTGAQTGIDRFASNESETSYRGALVYKPAEAGTLYLGWGTSFNPAAESVSFVSSGRNLATSNVGLEPEANESLELGVKWNLLNDQLFVDGAMFRITKDNAWVPDPQNPGFNTLGGEQEINGFSVNLSGGFGDILHFTTGYTFLDDEQHNQITGRSGRISNVAENSFSFWVNMAMGPSFDVGIGTRYQDERVENTKEVEDYWVWDAMAKYIYSENISFKINLTNVTDEYYIDQLHPWHVVPGPGFGVVFALNLDY